MMGAEFLLLVALSWILGSLFVAGVGGTTLGWRGFFVWFFAALLFSPLLALLALVAVLQSETIAWLREIREELGRAPTREGGGVGRFSESAGE